MKNLRSIAIACLVITGFSSCTKKDDPATAQTTVQITVADGRTGYAASNATVNLYDSMTAVNSNTPKYTQTTDQNNQVNITVAYLSQYYVVVTKSTAKNYYSVLTPIGLFQSQTDINNSPIQTPAGTIGGVKYRDTNGDGKIDNLDKTDAPTIAIQLGVTNTQTVTVY
jgi:hypothetical protein